MQQVTDAAAQSVAPVSRRRPLKTARHVARELSYLFWELREGRIEPALGGRLAFVLMGLARVIETADLEGRLLALEGSIDDGQATD